MNTRTHTRRGSSGRGWRGFTLIELLVVVSIIALLISNPVALIEEGPGAGQGWRCALPT